MTEQEAGTLVEKHLFSLKDNDVKVILAFQEKPDADTFRELEDTPRQAYLRSAGRSLRMALPYLL